MQRSSNKARKTGRTSLTIPSIEPLTEKQAVMLESTGDVVAHGSAGTGKTFCGLYMGLVEVLKKRNFDYLTIIRSAVETRKIGFLPGTDKEKTEVYEAPYKELCEELFNGVNAYEKLKLDGKIRFMTTSFIRGMNLRNCFALIDEYQNMTYHELDSVITRFSGDSRSVWCGDTYQADLGPQSGIKEFNPILKNMNGFEFIEFGIEDVVRGPKVKNYLETKYSLYGK